ncbi:hypothetical protein [Pseudomonas phage PPAT]|nr:hypothetical protein [Pseudomonas phage PPAT]
MAKTTNAAEFNTFVGGLITEASPLTFPQNASIDEVNFILNRDGSRNRRNGMDFENGATKVVCNTLVPADGTIAVTSHNWENAGGEVGRWISLVQVGTELKFFQTTGETLSEGNFYNYQFVNMSPSHKLSYAVVDGLLVVANGSRDIYVFEYNSGSVSVTTKRLLVRDLFGVQDIVNGVDLRQGNDIATRPTVQTNAHIYNLRNQTFGVPRATWHSNEPSDPIATFRSAASGKFPSNSDSVNLALSKRADVEPSTTDRFRAEDIVLNPIGTYETARGFFIIDAMARGKSRLEETVKLKQRYPSLSFGVSSLPQDETPGGASVVCEYAGRVWYAGFSGQIIDGDDQSPRLVSYILFSQLVDSPADIVNCYQDGDPTSTEEPELVDTDGGFIRIEGAYDIINLVNVGSAVMVVAANGIWMIQGGSDYGFTATNYLVTKISEHGCSSPNSVVVVDNSFMYWGDDGIYHLTRNQYGDYVANNLTEKTIQKYYEKIPSDAILNATGFYDSYDKKVKWLYNTVLDGRTEPVTELVFDLALGAFYPSKIGSLTAGRLPIPVGSVKIPPYKLVETDEEVTVNSEQVTVTGELVTVKISTRSPVIRETKYIIVEKLSSPMRISFGGYTDDEFVDWKSIDGVGVDAPAYLLTGYLAGGDYQREKFVPYITFHFKKTEDGFVEDAEGDWTPTNQSSCMVQSQWSWTNSPASNKWGRTWQAYRFRRHFFPDNIDNQFDDGNSVVETKSRLRGSGKVLSLYITTEPKKNLHIYGWSMLVDVNGTV